MTWWLSFYWDECRGKSLVRKAERFETKRQAIKRQRELENLWQASGFAIEEWNPNDK